MSAPKRVAPSSLVQKGRYAGIILPTDRNRSVAKAMPIAEPQNAIHLLPRYTTIDTKLDKLMSVLGAVIAYCRQEADPTDIYGDLLSVVSDDDIRRSFVCSLPMSSSGIMFDLLQGNEIATASMASAKPVRKQPRFNVPGIYLHVGRKDEVPGSRGIYVGMGSGTKGDSAEGVKGMVGCLKRIVAQHGSSRYRMKEHLRRFQRIGKRHAHYKMYLDNDTSDDAVYVLLGCATTSELDNWTRSTSSDIAVKRSRRAAILRMFETTFILAFGLCGWERKGPRALCKERGIHAPKLVYASRNQSIGLEGLKGEQRIGGSEGGEGGLRDHEQTQIAWGKEMGKPDGGKATWPEILKHRFGEAVWASWHTAAGIAVRDDRIVAVIDKWVNGELVPGNFTKEGFPMWTFLRSGDRTLLDLLGAPKTDAKATSFKLQLAVRGAKEDYQKPKHGALFWALTIGDYGDDGIPTGKGMTVRAYEVIDPDAIAKKGAALAEAAKDPSKRRQLERIPGIKARWNEKTAKIWDDDPECRTKRGTGRTSMTHRDRWAVFVKYIQYGYGMWLARNYGQLFNEPEEDEEDTV